MPTGWTGKDIVQTVINAIIGFGTIAAVIVVYCMSHHANKLTETAIESTLRVSETDLRPYVWFQNIGPEIPAVGTFATNIVVKNFGRTPAFNLSIDVYQHNDTSFDIRNPVSEPSASRAGSPILPPGAEQKFVVTTRKNLITKEILALVNAKRIYMFFAVKLGYDQRVGSNQIPHTTIFCLYYDPDDRTIKFYPKYNSDT